MESIKLYTDGSSLGNPGPAGYGFVLEYKGYRKFGGDMLNTMTNQQAELIAVINGLNAITDESIPVEVFSDSEYVVKGANEWLMRWWANGFKTSKGKPVKNADLWRELSDTIDAFDQVHFTWVKGHNGNEWNEVADDIAHTSAKLAHERLAEFA